MFTNRYFDYVCVCFTLASKTHNQIKIITPPSPQFSPQCSGAEQLFVLFPLWIYAEFLSADGTGTHSQASGAPKGLLGSSVQPSKKNPGGKKELKIV